MDKKLIDLIEGDIDTSLGKKIDTLVLKDEKFIIYLDETYEINWSTDGYKEFPPDFGLINNRMRTLESLANKIFHGKELRDMNYLLAEGLARVLDDKSTQNAKPILDEVEKTINEHGKQLLKIEYIEASFVTTILIGFLIIIFWIVRFDMIEIFNKPAFEIILASLCGGIGAFVSSFIRSLNFQGNIQVPKNTYQMEGFLRIFYGVIAGFVVTMAIKSNILLGVVNNVNYDSFPVFYFLATIAGASESFIPSIIKKVEEKVNL